MPLPKDFTFNIPSKKYPLWKGPEDSSNLGGITFSAISAWLNDRERFRIKYCVGLQPPDKFNVRLEYGNMWHVCEEYIDGNWQDELQRYAVELRKQYPFQIEEVTHWYNVCSRQFPHYINYWKKHPDTIERIPLASEEVFSIEYRISSGRTVYLRGKRDGTDLVRGNEIWLQENKTKGEIDTNGIERQLLWDLQTQIYLIALQRYDWRTRFDIMSSKSPLNIWSKAAIKGVRYNVVRRPLSGGKGTIRRHQPSKSNPEGESWESFYDRLEQYFIDEPGNYFYRWNVVITEKDIDNFRLRCLDPLLEQICYWYNCVSKCKDPYRCVHRVHWIHPSGCSNFLNDGGATPYDDFIVNGDETGLKYQTTLFPELR